MSTDDLEINLIQIPIKENRKTTILKQKKIKLKKSRKTSATQAILTRSKKQDNSDDDVILLGSSKPSLIPLTKKTVSKRYLKSKRSQKHPKMQFKKKEKAKKSIIQDLVIGWQKDLRKIMESTVVLSKKISKLE
ncbi:unnamed protein product [Paramecium sonneborni]|uniref:Uncharacterized protein n=1 Tax=Paramecium sonneborni TaxID=65129 RepID=A0A8S1M9L8_9CILI|nr:unnamed protein product [Paramecium sonneborni]